MILTSSGENELVKPGKRMIRERNKERTETSISCRFIKSNLYSLS